MIGSRLPSSVTEALSLARPTGFALHGELLSLCLCKEKVTQEKAHPAAGPARCAHGVRSLRRRSEGRRTRAIHGPLRLEPHPCGSTLCATTPLTRLTGPVPALPAVSTSFRAGRVLGGNGDVRSIRRADSPSRGRVEALRRGARGMDAERGAMGQGRPIVTSPGAAPERGKSRAARPECRGVFLCLAFFAQAKKVGRPGGRNPDSLARRKVSVSNPRRGFAFHGVLRQCVARQSSVVRAAIAECRPCA